MKIKNKLEDIVLKTEKTKLKNVIQDLMKKLLVTLMITTNVFFYIPAVVFAEDGDGDKKVPATVPAVANEIISKYVNTNFSSGSTSAAGGIITNYEESGDGWSSVTEVKAANGVTRTYRNYKQYDNGNTYWNKEYWPTGEYKNIGGAGCGPTAVAIVLSGYGYDSNPGDVVDVMYNVFNTKDSKSFQNLINPLEHIGNIDAEYHQGVGTSADISIIRENFKAGRPVIINAPNHFVVYLGEDQNGNLIISDPGAQDGGHARYGATLEEVINNGNITCGYILIKSDGNATSGSKSNSSDDEESSDKNKNNSSSDTSGTGEASTQKCELKNGGYEAIFTSGTTGRQFKEFKQNIDGASWNNSKYPISHLSGVWPNGWGSECSTVSVGIIGSGYTEQASFEDMRNKLISTDGNTNIPGWLSSYSGQSISKTSASKEQFKNALSNGSVAVIHDWGYSSAGHYMAVLDINKDKTEVYISNPDVYGTGDDEIHQGWNSIDDLYKAMEVKGPQGEDPKDEIYFVTNDGATVNYSGSVVTTLDNFLFIGDSRTYAIESDLKKLGKNITAKGVSSSKPSDWKQATKTGSGIVLGTSVTLPSKSEVKGVSVALGVNATNETSAMKDVLNNLLDRYPDTPIFVNSVFYVGQGYTLLNANTMNSNIDKFNEEIKEFCNSNSNLIYIDITKDLYESNYLKASYTGDNVHLNTTGNKKLVENIKDAILGSGRVTSSSSGINMSRNITDNGRGGYKIDIDLDEEVELMLERLKEEGFNLRRYLENSLQKKHLKNYLKAAIVTQYPDLRSAKEIANDDEIKDPTEVQGCIKVKRYTDEETEAFVGNSLSNPKDSDDGATYLSYKPYDEFSDLISNGDKSALNHFSLDSNNNMVVAGWETLDVSVSIEQIEGDPDPNPDPAPEPRAQEYAKLIEKKIDYINQVSNYTVPFSFLWSLLVYGNDEKFVNDFAQLVIDTEIVMGCYDATNIKNSTYTNTYTKTYTINRTAGIGDYAPTEGGYQARATSEEVKTCKYKVTEQHTLKTDTPSLKVKYANTWTAIYNNEYKVNNKSDNSTESTANLKDENLGSTYDYKYDEETKDIVDNDESLQKDIDSKIEELSKSTSEYNQQNFAYRYEKLTKALNEDYNYRVDSDDSYKLLHDEDVQNYLINMIIFENSQEYILNTFKNNETIKRAAKKISDTNYSDIQEDAGKCAQKIVSELETNNLSNKLTKDGADTRPNKTYSSEVTSVATEENVSKVDQKEKIETNTTKAKVEEVTSGTNNNVIMKIDKNSDENSFVKLLYYSKRAKSNLKIIDSWFFRSMENTAAIADMIDLVKYLFNEVYNGKTKYTQEQIDEIANLFDPKYFNNASNSNSSNGNYSTDLEKFIFGGEGGDEYIKGDIYIVYDIGDGCLNIGHGVVIGDSDGTPWYPELIPNPHVGQEISKEIHDKVYELKMKRFTNALDASLAKYGVTLKQYQYDAMISFLYNTGDGNSDIAVCAYKNGGEGGFWNEIKQYINPPEYRLGLMRRRAEEYELFTTGDYNYDPIYDGYRVKYY